MIRRFAAGSVKLDIGGSRSSRVESSTCLRFRVSWCSCDSRETGGSSCLLDIEGG